MKKFKILLISCIILASFPSLKSQDTFSIVAIDPITGEVGSAGASCVKKSILDNMGVEYDFLGQLFPGVGAINTQAYYSIVNQQNAANKILEDYSPQEIIDWLIENDVHGTPSIRQYGIVKLIDGVPYSSSFTGTNTDDFKGHITGDNYAIQGNILEGNHILKGMEERFLNESGCLAKKLMAALQGAKIPGADTRCLAQGVSSHFAFIKVAKSSDNPNDPYFRLSVAFDDNTEPIDSLQALFDIQQDPCQNLSLNEIYPSKKQIQISPMPVENEIQLFYSDLIINTISIIDIQGKMIFHLKEKNPKRINVKNLPSGNYFLYAETNQGITSIKFTKK